MRLPKKKELKSCPFCTGENSITIVHLPETDLPYWGECCLCKARGPARETRQAAVDAWNTRPFEDKFRQHDDDGMYLDGHEDGYFDGYQDADNAWREDVDALLEKVAELEWLREVEAYDPHTEHPLCTAAGNSNDRGKAFEGADDEYKAILTAAREAVEA